MAAPNEITCDKLYRLIGLPDGPIVVDVRTDEDYALLPAFIPAALRRRHKSVDEWAPALAERKVVVTCDKGGGIGAGIAAFLRAAGIEAESLTGGVRAWQAADYPLIEAKTVPSRDPAGRTLWVTRARPKVDRIACPWLIRRFIDREARFLFVAPAEVEAVAEKFGATPFDVEGVQWSHRGEYCSFDTMVEGFGLAAVPGLERLALIVRGADTARPELAPQAAGLLAVSLGLSRLHGDDHRQLEAGMSIYDSHRWCRDAVDETHDWTSHQPRQKRES